MRKEYKSIREVVGPLMMVKDVEGVKYDELVEIEQADGTIRRGRVLEINGDKAMVQLFEGSQGLRISDSKARFLGHSIQLAVAPDMLGHFGQVQSEIRPHGLHACRSGPVHGVQAVHFGEHLGERRVPPEGMADVEDRDRSAAVAAGPDGAVLVVREGVLIRDVAVV